MSEFEVKTDRLKANADNEKRIAKKIEVLSRDIRAVAAKIHLDARSERMVRQNLNALAQSNESNALKIKNLSDTLNMITNCYIQTEQKISGKESSGSLNLRDEIKKKLTNLIAEVRKIGKWLGMDSASFFSGDPVNLANGNYVYEKNFFHFDTILPMNIRFFYNVKSTREGTLGKGWIHNFECCIYKVENTLRFMKEDGDEEIFSRHNGEWLASAGTFGTLKESENGYIHTSEEGYISCFDMDGKLLSYSTADGWKIELHYEDGRLVSVNCTDGIEYHFSYNQDGNLNQIKDHTDRMILMKYVKKMLSSVTDPQGNETKYEYSKEGYLSRIITPLNNIGLQNEFDSTGRTILQTFPDGGQVKYLYDDENSSVTMIQQNGEKTEYVHDALYRNTKVVYSDGEENITFNENNQKTSFTDKMGNRTWYDYDEHGHLTGITNALSNKLELSYNEQGKLYEVRLDGERISGCEFDDEGRQKACIDANGNRVEFEYDTLGRVVKNVHEDGSITKLCYDKDGNILLVEDPLTGVTAYTYDACRRVVKTTDAFGNETKYTYDQNDNLIEVTDAEENSRHYEYDAQGNLIRLNDFNHGITEVEYNAMNKPVLVRDADGNTTRYEYDNMSNIIRIVTADGAETCYEYDGLNRKTRIIYPSGGEEKAEYDACGNLIKRIAQDGGEYTFQYDALGHPVEITDPEGHTRRAVFDNQGNATDIFYEDGSEEHFRFDLMGNRIFWQDKSGYERYYSYDALGNITQISDKKGVLVEYTYYPGGKIHTEKCIDGAEVAYHYDAVGNIIQAESSTEGTWKIGYDKLGRIIQVERENIGIEYYEYNAVGNITAMTDGAGNRTVYDYSQAGALLRITDPNGVQTGYRYDGCYRLLDMICPENGHVDIQKLNEYNRSQKEIRFTTYTRDISGNVTAVTDPDGNTAEYQYDLCGRIIFKKDEEGNVTTCVYRKDGTEEKISFQDGRSILYQYDALKRLIQIEDWLGITRFQRDEQGRLIRVTDHQGQTTSYQWDDRGDCTQIIYPDGKKAKYQYDDAMHLIRTQYEEQTAQYTYYKNGLRKERKLSGGVSSRYTYNQSGNIAELSHFQNNKLLDQYQYFYDTCGRKSRIMERHDDPSMEKESRYHYNSLGCISAVEEDGQKTEKYTYDIFGNRIESVCQGVTTTFGYDRLNRLTGSETLGESRKYTYDRRGNLAGVAVNGVQKMTLHFDALNRLANATSDIGDATYEYNGLDVLTGVRKRTAGTNKNESYSYDYTKTYHNLIALKNGNQENNYVWEQELLWETKENTVSIFLNDERMNPVRMLTNGMMQEHSSYDIWGNRKSVSDRQEENIAGFGFTGYRRDEITGYYYAGKRNYDSTTGRFIAKDPVEGSPYYPISCNPFIYCACDPINRYDPSGAVAIWIAGGIVGGFSNICGKFAGDVVKSIKKGKVTFSPLEEYFGAAAGGFVEGAVYVTAIRTPGLATHSATLAGGAGASTEAFVSNGLKMLSGRKGYRKEDGYTAGKLFKDTVISGAEGAGTGFVFGKVGEYLKLKGITKGTGCWDADFRRHIHTVRIRDMKKKTIFHGIVTQGIIKSAEHVIGETIKWGKEQITDFTKKTVKNLLSDLFENIQPEMWAPMLSLIFTNSRLASCPAAGL